MDSSPPQVTLSIVTRAFVVHENNRSLCTIMVPIETGRTPHFDSSPQRFEYLSVSVPEEAICKMRSSNVKEE